MFVTKLKQRYIKKKLKILWQIIKALIFVKINLTKTSIILINTFVIYTLVTNYTQFEYYVLKSYDTRSIKTI